MRTVSYVDQGANRYVVGNVTPYDQKNEMFKRCWWDPSMAALGEKFYHNISNREGVRAWHINAETCLSFWARNGTDCSNCIRVCPFNKPSGKFHDMVKWGVNNTRRLNQLFLWGDDFIGYGKKKDPNIF